jgi:hypothetical protein
MDKYDLLAIGGTLMIAVGCGLLFGVGATLAIVGLGILITGIGGAISPGKKVE